MYKRFSASDGCFDFPFFTFKSTFFTIASPGVDAVNPTSAMFPVVCGADLPRLAALIDVAVDGFSNY